ncbi:MAG: hypothetical protein MUP66_00955 [Candidatus Nanohaloarchaeota archaeon QJJ-5]|nr:hypothetical protein [Candidatus Nanohaloarchaeota archaeon QJJ-5]
MVEFETIDSEEITFGNEFIEVARKRAISEDGENIFLSLTRGYFADDGSRRYKSNFSIPRDSDVIEFITDTLPEMNE